MGKQVRKQEIRRKQVRQKKLRMLRIKYQTTKNEGAREEILNKMKKIAPWLSEDQLLLK